MFNRDTLKDKPYFSVGKQETFLFERGEKTAIKKLTRKYGKHWKYADYKENPIVVNTNEFGYRSTTVYPPQEDYYLMLGCSHTFGQYLHDEHVASNIIEDKLNKPVINLGIKGGSANAIGLNVHKLMESNYNKPKAIIAQWPQLYRYLIFGENSKLSFHPMMENTDMFEAVLNIPKSFEIASSHAYNYVNSLDIPVINYSLNGETARFFNIPFFNRIDTARDDHHPGQETNIGIANYILGKLNV